jgi:nucleotide-binding universal stress UspA family protein
MSLINKILVALDGSDHSARALDYAIDLAEKYSAEIVLLSVFQPATAPIVLYPVSSMPAIPPVAMGTYSEEVKTRHEKLLSEAREKTQKTKPNLKVTTELAEGRPSNKIIETAKKGNFDLIVMGSRGLGGIKEFFLGSVSDRVADEATCPVLLVK